MSSKNIKNKKDIEVFAPLRSKSFYKSLGYEKIHELDWDQSKTIGDLKFTAKTSYHWSKTGLFDRNKTLPKKTVRSIKLGTIPPMIWNGFCSADNNLAVLANCSDIPHDKEEIVRVPFDDPKIPYNWAK